jgi:hypothetical protein
VAIFSSSDQHQCSDLLGGEMISRSSILPIKYKEWRVNLCAVLNAGTTDEQTVAVSSSVSGKIKSMENRALRKLRTRGNIDSTTVGNGAIVKWP